MQDNNISLQDSWQEPSNKALAERSNSTPSPYLAEPRLDPQEAEDGDLSLADLWRVLVKRRWTIFTFLLIVLTSVVTATFLMTPTYRASLTLQIEREPAKVLDFQTVTPNESENSGDFYQTQYELLRSRSLAKRVVDQLNLTQHPLFATHNETSFLGSLTGWFNNASEAEKSQPADNNDVVERFLGSLSIEPIRNSRLVKVHFTSPDSEVAAQIVNAFADVFINMNLERRFEASSYAKEFLSDRLQQIKAKLEDSERQLVQFARQEQIINIDDRKTINLQTLQQLTDALAKAEEERIRQEALYLQARQNGGSILSPVLQSPVIQEFKNIQAKLEAEYQDNLRLYKPAYPKMRQLQGQINELQRKISQEMVNIQEAIRVDYRTAKANEDLLRQKLEEVKSEVMGLQDRSIQYNILKREVDTNRQFYDGLLQRYKEIGVAGGVGANNISIIDRAETPAFPFKPNLQINALLALLFGLLGGIGLAFLVEHLDDTVKLPEDVERLLNIPVLGIIPSVRETRGREYPEQSLYLTAQTDPRSAFAEAYRSVRTALQFSTPEGAPKTLLVTSSVAGEGKSTTSLSLAIHFAQASKKVLLIDADLRNPSLHHELNIDNSCGLTNYLAGNAKPVEIAKQAPIENLENLFVVSAGTLPPNPAELLSTPKMMTFLSLAAKKFDQIIVDGPPVLGLADALILGNLSDATLLVIEANGTRRGAVQGSIKRLRSSRTRVLGGILTKLEADSHAYGYQQSYYYYDGADDSPKRLPS